MRFFGIAITIGLLAACAAPDAGPTLPREITVVATDYAFEAPDTVEAGLVAWRLENRGQAGHHLIIARVPDTLSAADAVARVAAGEEGDWLETLGGVEGAPAGGPVDRFITPLEPGTYLLVCVLSNTLGESHAKHGMVRPMVVRADAGSPTVEVTATDTLRLVDFAYGVADTVLPGPVRFRVENRGAQRHHAMLERIPDGMTHEEMLASLASESDTPPPGFTSMGGFTSIAPGRHGWFEVDLAPGRYALFCLIPDPASGRLHAELGMVRLFEVR